MSCRPPRACAALSRSLMVRSRFSLLASACETTFWTRGSKISRASSCARASIIRAKTRTTWRDDAPRASGRWPVLSLPTQTAQVSRRDSREPLEREANSSRASGFPQGGPKPSLNRVRLGMLGDFPNLSRVVCRISGPTSSRA